jgi:hypothetical protein
MESQKAEKMKNVDKKINVHISNKYYLNAHFENQLQKYSKNITQRILGLAIAKSIASPPASGMRELDWEETTLGVRERTVMF